jgi:hypothetical protein
MANQKEDNQEDRPEKKERNDPFLEGFDPVAYLKEFYPALDSKISARVLEIISELHLEIKEGDISRIDIRPIREMITREFGDSGEKTLESIENICIFRFMLQTAIPEILKQKPEDHLRILDVGGGPTIYQHILLMGISKPGSIFHTEYLDANRSEVERWISGASEFDWKSYFAFYQAYLARNPDVFLGATKEVQDRFRWMEKETPEALEAYLRTQIAAVLPVDVFREDLGISGEHALQDPDVVHIGKEGSAQLVTSNFCIESATPSEEQWKKGIRNVAAQVPEGGFLLMTAIRNAKKYKVGLHEMPAVPVDAQKLSQTLREEGFHMLSISELIGSDLATVGYDGMVFVLAQRKEHQKAPSV